MPAAQALMRGHGARIYSRHGFADAFNPSVRGGDPHRSGTTDPVHAWVASDRLGIDQGPILAMIANAKDDLIWRAMRNDPSLSRGLERAGFRRFREV